jgi:hypothetical protein
MLRMQEITFPGFKFQTNFLGEYTPAGLDNIFSCLRVKFKMCLQKHILFRFCDLNIVKMSVF